MSESTQNTADESGENSDLPVQDELTTLKARADMMGLSYHPSIGVNALKEKIANALAAEPKASQAPEATNDQSGTQAKDQAKTPAPAVPDEPVEETQAARRARKRREANELVRIRVTCMNPAKREWEGEIFTAGNSLVGSFTKFVPFNNEEGWHVPRIILNQLQQRECQIFTSKKDERGNAVRKSKMIREFAIEILPPLTEEELTALAQRQQMANGSGTSN